MSPRIPHSTVASVRIHLVAPPAKRPPVAAIPEQRLFAPVRNDVVYDCRAACALPVGRVSFQELIARLLPLRPVATLGRFRAIVRRPKGRLRGCVFWTPCAYLEENPAIWPAASSARGNPSAAIPPCGPRSPDLREADVATWREHCGIVAVLVYGPGTVPVHDLSAVFLEFPFLFRPGLKLSDLTFRQNEAAPVMWSPDGRLLSYFFRDKDNAPDGTLKVIPASGGGPRVVAKVQEIYANRGMA